MKNIITIFIFFLALSILLGLSAWQVQRLDWKNEIISQLESEYAKAPADNVYSRNDLHALGDEIRPIRYGRIIGRFDHKKEIILGPKTHEGDIGYHLITPLTLTGGGVIFVQRGWVDQKNLDQISTTHTKSQVKIDGVIRKPEWNKFTPDNSPENDIWIKPDITDIARAKNIKNIAPVMIYAENNASASDILIPQAEKWFPRNKHKQYALFWFSMAFVMVVIAGLVCFRKKHS